MEAFDIKTASTLLPVMNDTENSIKKLISSVEMYNSVLEPRSKPMLVNFVLKTRLSESAKLRLSNNYQTAEGLVSDMKKQLIPKKSFVAIQEQLQRCTQNQRTITDYGKEIEKLFVELTITQAEGDPNKERILKPINEKMAINRFATGLHNRNLSTIILARNYNTLKDAIQGAKDQEKSAKPVSGSSVKTTIVNKPYITNNTASSTKGQSSQNRGGSNQYSHRGTSRGGYHNTVTPTPNNSQANRGTTSNYTGRGNHHQPSSSGPTINISANIVYPKTKPGSNEKPKTHVKKFK